MSDKLKILVLDTLYLLQTAVFVWFVPYKVAERRLLFIMTGLSPDRIHRFPAKYIIILYRKRLKR